MTARETVRRNRPRVPAAVERLAPGMLALATLGADCGGGAFPTRDTLHARRVVRVQVYPGDPPPGGGRPRCRDDRLHRGRADVRARQRPRRGLRSRRRRGLGPRRHANGLTSVHLVALAQPTPGARRKVRESAGARSRCSRRRLRSGRRTSARSSPSVTRGRHEGRLPARGSRTRPVRSAGTFYGKWKGPSPRGQAAYDLAAGCPHAVAVARLPAHSRHSSRASALVARIARVELPCGSPRSCSS